MKYKNYLLIGLGALLTLSACTPTTTTKDSTEDTTGITSSLDILESKETNAITLSDTEITVNGKTLGTDATKDIYQLENSMETESVKNIIVISKPGTYEFTGTLSNGQIRVNTDVNKKEKTTILLNGVTLTTPDEAPAIYIQKAPDSSTAEDSYVSLTAKNGSTNTITGGYYDDFDDGSGTLRDNDGAISSNVSLALDGDGSLTVRGAKEGIEVLTNLLITSGTYDIQANDDAINASTDGDSHIVINGGTIYAAASMGNEGDGIDSNGDITINGGHIYAFSNPNSMDSGLDSDLGIQINGGTVYAAGMMYDEILESSNQNFLVLQLDNNRSNPMDSKAPDSPPLDLPTPNENSGGEEPFKPSKEDLPQGNGTPQATSKENIKENAKDSSNLLAILDSEGNPLTALDGADYSTLIYSSSEVHAQDSYIVYQGISVEGTQEHGSYTSITSLEKGEELMSVTPNEVPKNNQMPPSPMPSKKDEEETES